MGKVYTGSVGGGLIKAQNGDKHRTVKKTVLSKEKEQDQASQNGETLEGGQIASRTNFPVASYL